MPLLEASCTPQGPRLPPWRPSGRKTLASLNRDFASGRQWSQKRRTTACSRARLAVSTAASASRLARASADEPAALHSMCTSRRRHSDARPQCFSNTVTHWYQAVCLERVSANPYYVRSARGRRPMLIAVPGAAPVERSAEQPSTTTEDAGALHKTRGASMTFPSKLLSRSVYSENGERAQR